MRETRARTAVQGHRLEKQISTGLQQRSLGANMAGTIPFCCVEAFPHEAGIDSA